MVHWRLSISENAECECLFLHILCDWSVTSSGCILPLGESQFGSRQLRAALLARFDCLGKLTYFSEISDDHLAPDLTPLRMGVCLFSFFHSVIMPCLWLFATQNRSSSSTIRTPQHLPARPAPLPLLGLEEPGQTIRRLTRGRTWRRAKTPSAWNRELAKSLLYKVNYQQGTLVGSIRESCNMTTFILEKNVTWLSQHYHYYLV